MSSTEYATRGEFAINGRAIVIDLRDAQIDGCMVDDPHATVLFRKAPVWTEEELNQINEIAANFRRVNKLRRIPFSLSPWGPNSVLIEGDIIRNFCKMVEDQFAEYQNDRPLHVNLRGQRGIAEGAKKRAI